MKMSLKFRYLFMICLFVSSQALVAGEISFPKQKISVGSKKLTVEVARTPEQMARGLMHRQHLDENAGMLFIYPDERPLSFWMKNTFIPLSIGFFNKDKKLLEIIDMTPVGSVLQLSIPSYQSKSPAQYALEVNQGWFAKHGLKTGAILKIGK